MLLSVDPYLPVSGFGLQVTCSLTFVIMFLPKKRQRTALGKDGLYESIATNVLKSIQFPVRREGLTYKKDGLFNANMGRHQYSGIKLHF